MYDVVSAALNSATPLCLLPEMHAPEAFCLDGVEWVRAHICLPRLRHFLCGSGLDRVWVAVATTHALRGGRLQSSRCAVA